MAFGLATGENDSVARDKSSAARAVGSPVSFLNARPAIRYTLSIRIRQLEAERLRAAADRKIRKAAIKLKFDGIIRSREFVAFLKLVDAAYPAHTAIKLILDNHPAHVSKETTAWLATRPEGRFSLVFRPKHGSWLNRLEGFFSTMAQPLRRIRVASKVKFKSRFLGCLDEVNSEPVIHTWTYNIGEAA